MHQGSWKIGICLPKLNKFIKYSGANDFWIREKSREIGRIRAISYEFTRIRTNSHSEFQRFRANSREIVRIRAKSAEFATANKFSKIRVFKGKMP